MLNKSVLEQSLLRIIDKDNQDFIGFSNSVYEAALLFADSFYNYINEIIPVSTAHSAAKMSFISIFSGINRYNYRTQFNLAYITYVSIMANGMQPTFTPILPPTQLDLVPIFDKSIREYLKASEVANLMADKIHTYVKSGKATNNNSGTVVSWN